MRRTGSGSATTRPPDRARASSSVIQPAGATLRTPTTWLSSTVATAPARSSTCKNCTGREPSPDPMPATPPRSADGQSSPPFTTTVHGRNTVTAHPGWSADHSSPRRSISARSLTSWMPGFGRRIASSVNGIGLSGHAPYTAAVDNSTTCSAPMPAAASSTASVADGDAACTTAVAPASAALSSMVDPSSATWITSWPSSRKRRAIAAPTVVAAPRTAVVAIALRCTA